MQHSMNGKIKRLLILGIILKGCSTKVKIVKVSGRRLGRKEATKVGQRNKAKNINKKNGKNVGIKKWTVMTRQKNQIVKNGAKIKKKNGMRNGVRFIGMDRNKNGVINGLLKMGLRGVRNGDRITQMIIRLKNIGLRNGMKLMGFMRRDMRFID